MLILRLAGALNISLQGTIDGIARQQGCELCVATPKNCGFGREVKEEQRR
jgi:hypothetical protein